MARQRRTYTQEFEQSAVLWAKIDRAAVDAALLRLPFRFHMLQFGLGTTHRYTLTQCVFPLLLCLSGP